MAIAGVAAYASILALQALVLDPLAAVPGQTLGQIHAHLLADGMNVNVDNVSVIASAAIGVGLAAGVAVAGALTRLPLWAMVAMFLAIIALGAFVTFGSGFALRMDVADSYGTDGGDHTIWAGVLYITSFLACVGMVIVLAIALVRGVRNLSNGWRPATRSQQPQ